MSVLDRIERLRNVMEQQKIDCYIIPTDDYHHSETSVIILNSANI